MSDIHIDLDVPQPLRIEIAVNFPSPGSGFLAVADDGDGNLTLASNAYSGVDDGTGNVILT